MSPATSIDGILAGQAGLITREQALLAGLPAPLVDRMLRLRRWRPVHPRVYLATDHGSGQGPDDETRTRAALLWAGRDAVLCGAAAAWWHGLVDRAPAAITVAIGRRGPHPRPDVHLRRRVLAPPDVVAARGIAVTAAALTLLEAAVELGSADLLDRGLRGAIRFATVRAAHRRHPSPAAAALLAEAAARSAPVAVGLLHRLLHGGGITGWHATASGAAFPTLTVEAVGWAWAPPPAAALRFTWHDLTERSDDVLRVICATLGHRSAAPNGGPARPGQ